MPTKKKPVPLSKSIKVRFATPAEKQAVARAAKFLNVSISRFIADAALERIGAKRKPGTKRAKAS